MLLYSVGGGMVGVKARLQLVPLPKSQLEHLTAVALTAMVLFSVGGGILGVK